MSVNLADDTKDFLQLRKQLRANKNVRFVSREEFCQLLTSCKKLRRYDLPHASLRGLHDPDNQVNYVIEEELLH